MSAPKKVVLAYSGGLDTSIILKWLQTEYDCEVVTFTADLGQGEELEPARAKAEMMGASSIYIEDVREEFARDFVFPMSRANAVYEGLYLLGTSIARPLISKRLVEIAEETGADAIAHGATGKGNDQVRFELAAYALNPDIKVIAPWREWDLSSRTKLIDFAEKNQSQSPQTNAAKHRLAWTQTCCTHLQRVKFSKIQQSMHQNTCTSARYPQRMHRTKLNTSKSVLKKATRFPSTAWQCHQQQF